MKALADPAFFVEGIAVDPDGYSLGWPSTPLAPEEVGGIDFSAQGLWYRAIRKILSATTRLLRSDPHARWYGCPASSCWAR
jgi:hypothetical protein